MIIEEKDQKKLGKLNDLGIKLVGSGVLSSEKVTPFVIKSFGAEKMDSAFNFLVLQKVCF